MLPGLHRPDGCERLPVVRGGGGDGVDGLVIENPAQVRDESRGHTALLFDRLHSRRTVRLINVAQRHNFAAMIAVELANVAAAAAAAADDGDANRICQTGAFVLL